MLIEKLKVLDNKVWVILRPVYGIYGTLQSVGICGSGFFINQNTFITCHHCVNNSSFRPNESYNNTDLILLSPDQERCINETDVIKYDQDKDITYIGFSDSNEYLELYKDAKEKDDVYNIGYPSDEVALLLQPAPLKIVEQRIQRGAIKLIDEKYSILADDIMINNAKVLILDYRSVVGYSGGPLLCDGKVIGIMSHNSPRHGGLVVAIASSEFKL